jgi:hypothetical protein
MRRKSKRKEQRHDFPVIKKHSCMGLKSDKLNDEVPVILYYMHMDPQSFQSPAGDHRICKLQPLFDGGIYTPFLL